MSNNDDGPTPGPKIMTNIEMIKTYVTSPNQMNQIFLIAAVDSYVDWCLKHPEEVRSQWMNTLINPEAWLEAAQAWKQLTDARIEANRHLAIVVITE